MSGTGIEVRHSSPLTKAWPRVAGQGTGELRRAGEPANVLTIAVTCELAAIAMAVMPPPEATAGWRHQGSLRFRQGGCAEALWPFPQKQLMAVAVALTTGRLYCIDLQTKAKTQCRSLRRQLAEGALVPLGWAGAVIHSTHLFTD